MPQHSSGSAHRGAPEETPPKVEQHSEDLGGKIPEQTAGFEVFFSPYRSPDGTAYEMILDVPGLDAYEKCLLVGGAGSKYFSYRTRPAFPGGIDLTAAHCLHGMFGRSVMYLSPAPFSYGPLSGNPIRYLPSTPSSDVPLSREDEEMTELLSLILDDAIESERRTGVSIERFSETLKAFQQWASDKLEGMPSTSGA
jgi:hypothetical protein